jgi:general secretion pathway protein I
VDQLTKSVREVHLTVSWKEGKLTETFDVVTHVVSLGPGSDRNGGAAAAAAAAAGGTTPPSGEQWVRVTDGQVVPNPVPAPNGSGMVEPGTNTQLMPLSQWQAQRGNGNSPTIPGLPGVNPALLDRSGNPRLLPTGLGTVR